MATEAATEDYRQQATTIDLSPAAKMRIIMSLRAARRVFGDAMIYQLMLAAPDYAYLHKNWFFLASADGQRYLKSEELRLTLETLLTGSLDAALEAAFDESREPLVFRRAFPHPEFLRRLVEKFVASENPRRLRRVLLISEGDEPQATSASFHLPQAYETSFPCSRCTVYRTENETYPMFVEVFHFANRNNASVCATVAFRMTADLDTNDITTSDSRVEVYLTETCRPQKADFSRPSQKLFTQFDTFFGVLQEVNPDGLEKLQAVSGCWRATIDRHKKALSRRKFIVNICFKGEDPTVVTVSLTLWNGEYEQVLRVLVPHSLEQLSRMLCGHLRDARVKLGFFSEIDYPFRHPPQDATLHWDESKTLGWTIHLFQSLKHTQVERVLVDSELFGIDNVSASMNVARISCSVGTFDLINLSSDPFTMHQVVGLLRDPAAVASGNIVVRTWTPTSADYSMLEDFLFSTTSPAFVLRLFPWLEMPFPPTTLLTLPTRFLQRFLDAKDTTKVISEFHLVLHKFEGAAFVDLPPTHRMKQFRHNRYGKEVTSRVHTYRNANTGELLSAVRQVDRTYYSSVLFLKGHISLDNLRSKWTNDKY